jgi:hypothetical protein
VLEDGRKYLASFPCTGESKSSKRCAPCKRSLGCRAVRMPAEERLIHGFVTIKLDVGSLRTHTNEKMVMGCRVK